MWQARFLKECGANYMSEKKTVQISVDLDQANIWLYGAIAAFILTLWYKMQNPGDFYAEGLHFMAEAALVGGIADWFAVTAIFKHPWGLSFIPYTAILPSKKDDFAKGASEFVKKLLTDETIVNEIRGMNILDMIASKLRDSERREAAVVYLMDLIKDRLSAANRDENIAEISNEIRRKLMDYGAKDLIRRLIGWLKEGNNGSEVLEWVSSILKREINSEESRRKLETMFSELKENISEGFFDKFKIWAGEKINLINMGDVTEITQDELLKFASDLGIRNSDAQRRTLRLIFENADNLSSDRELIRALDEFRKKLIEKIPLEEAIKDIFAKFLTSFEEEDTRKKISERAEMAFRSHIAEILRNQFSLVVNLLKNDSELQHDLDEFLKGVATTFTTDVASKSIEKIVKRVLTNMKDDELNEIVRSKVNDDLMFIRINGVKVGAIIGGLLFGCMYAYNNFAM